MSHLAAVRGVLPEHRYAQAEVTEAFADVLGSDGADRALLERFHANAGVSQRHLALPLERYWRARRTSARPTTSSSAVAVELGCARRRPRRSRRPVSPRRTSTSSSRRRSPGSPSRRSRPGSPRGSGCAPTSSASRWSGSGCVAGAAGVARVHDYLLGHPDEVAVLLSVELCSLTVQRDDRLDRQPRRQRPLRRRRRRRRHGRAPTAPPRLAPGQPRVVATRSRLYPDTERAMGWDVGATGLRIVLGAEVPDLVRDEPRATTSTGSSPTTG